MALHKVTKVVEVDLFMRWFFLLHGIVLEREATYLAALENGNVTQLLVPRHIMQRTDWNDLHLSMEP